jgi:hypothetical protein
MPSLIIFKHCVHNSLLFSLYLKSTKNDIYDWLSKNVPFHDLGVSEILAINPGPNGYKPAKIR